MLSILFRDRVPLKNALQTTISKSQIKIVYNHGSFNIHSNFSAKSYAREDKAGTSWKKDKVKRATGKSLEADKKKKLLKEPMQNLMVAVEENFRRRKVTQISSDKLFTESIHLYDISILSNVMRMSTQSAKGQPDLLLKSHLPLIASRLRTLSARYNILKPWSYKHLAFMAYGLRDVTEGDEGVTDILSVINKIGTINMTDKTPTAMQDIAMMLTALKENNGEGEESKKLLSLVASMVGKCPGAFKARGMGNALWALKEMGSDGVEVRSVLSALALKIENSDSKKKMKYIEVINVLRGMVKMNTDCDEVKAVFKALVPIIEMNSYKLEVKEEKLVLEALEALNGESDEIKAIKKAFQSKYLKKT
jgi:hypothetical protein